MLENAEHKNNSCWLKENHTFFNPLFSDDPISAIIIVRDGEGILNLLLVSIALRIGQDFVLMCPGMDLV